MLASERKLIAHEQASCSSPFRFVRGISRGAKMNTRVTSLLVGALWSVSVIGYAHECQDPCVDAEMTQAAEQALGAACGFPPEQSCALSFWVYLATNIEESAVLAVEFLTDPNLPAYCQFDPPNCYLGIQSSYHIIGLFAYYVGRAEDYA